MKIVATLKSFVNASQDKKKLETIFAAKNLLHVVYLKFSTLYIEFLSQFSEGSRFSKYPIRHKLLMQGRGTILYNKLLVDKEIILVFIEMLMGKLMRLR